MKSPSSFIAITSEGGLLPADFLHELPDPKTTIEGVTPVAYHLAEGERLNEQINRSWNRLKGCWENFKKAVAEKPAGDPTTTDTRERWLFPLFQELGFGRLTAAKPIEVDGRSYSVSHGWNQVPIHLVGSHADLDHRTPGAIGASKASPHSLVQSALNASDAHLWGIVSNGFNLRLLRDNIALTRLAFVEFDLQAMFDGDLYSEFFVLWLVCHQSRFEGEKTDQYWLERWKKSAEDKTLRALDDLYPGVKKAIAVLGAGLVSNRANGVLLEKLRTGRLSTQEFYKQVLRVIYRLLFLLVAEDRDLLHLVDDTEAGIKARRRYREFYSITRLRALTIYRAGTPHPDLWQVFQLVTATLGSDTGCPELALPPLGSFLWTAAQSTPDLLDSLISNRHFLEAVHALAFVQDNNVRRAVDYKNLGSEELGSVYQGLLEMHPRINADAGSFELDIAAGNERKTSGSYYTPDSLVQCLLDSALEPVIAERLAKAKTPKEKETALLSLKVCDMAAGSGHFIIRAGHRIARHLARVRSGEDEPSPTIYRTALRDVIGHCLYGVDINPMAVELCKVTLWLEALEPGKPLSFLDHHIRCGNSLLGATPELIAAGLPDDAFEAIEGDDKSACASLKKLNRAQREGLRHMFIAEDTAIRERLHQAAAAIDEIKDNLPEDIHRKEAAFRSAQTNYDFGKAWDLANLWCAAFVIKKHFAGGAIASGAATVPASAESATLNDQPLVTQGGLFGGTEEFPKTKGKKPKSSSHASSEIPFGITTQTLRDFVENGVLPDGLLAETKQLADSYQFFHYHLAFPEVSVQGGFDVSLGNPPWEMMELSEKEFFAQIAPTIAEAASARQRQALIKCLEKDNPRVFEIYTIAKRMNSGFRHFVQHSGVYPTSSTGRINLYPLFVEGLSNLISSTGRAGVIVPSAISMDAYNAPLFMKLVMGNRLSSLLDFENAAAIFSEVHRSYRFCLLTLCGPKVKGEKIEFCYFAHSVDDLKDKERRTALTSDDIAIFSPNTLAPPMLLNAKDTVLARLAYGAFGVLANLQKPSEDGWSASIQRMLSLSDPGDMFRLADELGDDVDNSDWTRLCCGKAIHQYDHRYASWLDSDWESFGAKRHCDPTAVIRTEYYARSFEVQNRLADKRTKRWLLSYRDVCRATDERTVIGAVIPPIGCDTTCRNIYLNGSARLYASFVGNINAFPFDYFTRQKVIGIHLGAGVFEQLPTIPPKIYGQTSRWSDRTELLQDWLLPRVLELTYTAWDLEAFAQDCGWSGPPFRWDEDRRFLLRCELDAAFFHLYLGSETEWRQQPEALTKAFPTPRHAVDYILDTFPIVKRKDEAKFNGDYRTKRVILEIYDALAASMQTGKAYQTRLNPAPASLAVAHLPRFDHERFNFKEAGDYILPFVASLLRHHGGECDVMILIRGYAMLLGDRKTLTTLTEARFGAEAGTWVKRFNQPVDASWFLPILRGLDNRDVIKLEERGENDVFVRLLDASVPSNSTVETDVYLLLQVLDLNAVPPAAVAEQVKRISPKAVRTSLHEAKLVTA